jgi:hypothetical protein
MPHCTLHLLRRMWRALVTIQNTFVIVEQVQPIDSWLAAIDLKLVFV